jgi:hypothetical protein
VAIDKQIQFNYNATFGAISNTTAGYILTSNGLTTTASFQVNTGISTLEKLLQWQSFSDNI